MSFQNDVLSVFKKSFSCFTDVLASNVGWHIPRIIKFTWFWTGLSTHWFMIAPITRGQAFKLKPKMKFQNVTCSSGSSINCKLIFVHVPLSIYTWFWCGYIWFNCSLWHTKGSVMQHGSFLPIQILDRQNSRQKYWDFSQYGMHFIRF